MKLQKLKLTLSAAVVVVGASLLGLPVPASAQLAGFSKNLPAQFGNSSLIEKVQRKRGAKRARGGGNRRGGGGNRRRGGGGNAAAVGAAIGVIGGIIASEAARQHEQRVEDCFRHHRRGYFYRHGRRIYCDSL